MSEAVILGDPMELEALVPEWTSLCSEVARTPFAWPSWQLPWIRTFVPDGHLVAVVVKGRGRVDGLLTWHRDPTNRRRLLPPGGAWVFLNEPPMRSHKAASVALDALCSHGGWEEVLLHSLDPGHPGSAVVLEACRAHPRVILDAPSPGGSALVKLEGDWDAWLSRRSRHWRHEMRRKRRRAEKRSELRLSASAGIPCAEDREAVLRVEENSWKARVGSTFAGRENYLVFLQQLWDEWQGPGLFETAVLYIDGHPAAFTLALVWGAKVWALKTSFDEAVAELAPGVLLIDSMLERWARAGVEVVDLLGSPVRWKRERADGLASRCSGTLYPASLWNRARTSLRRRVRASRRSLAGRG